MSTLPALSPRPLPAPLIPPGAVWSVQAHADVPMLAWGAADAARNRLLGGVLRLHQGHWEETASWNQTGQGPVRVVWDGTGERVRWQGAEWTGDRVRTDSGWVEVEPGDDWCRQQVAHDGMTIRLMENEQFPAPGPVHALAVTPDGWLYAAGEDPARGANVWRRRFADSGIWEAVIERGGHRYSFAARVAGLVSCGGKVLLGTLPSHAVRGGLHCGFELLEISLDGWHVLAGELRITPHGLEVPLSGHGPGFHALMPSDLLFFTAAAGRPLAGMRNDVDGFRIWSGNGDDWQPVSDSTLCGYDKVLRAECVAAGEEAVMVWESEDAIGMRRMRAVALS